MYFIFWHHSAEHNFRGTRRPPRLIGHSRFCIPRAGPGPKQFGPRSAEIGPLRAGVGPRRAGIGPLRAPRAGPCPRQFGPQTIRAPKGRNWALRLRDILGFRRVCRPIGSRTGRPLQHLLGGDRGWYSMLRNSASGPEIGLPGRSLAGLQPGRHRNRPSSRPSAGQRADFEALPIRIRSESGPKDRFPARKRHCVT